MDDGVGIVIIGAGQAGVELAAALRGGGYAGKLTLVGDEPVAPYQRPPLSKAYLLGGMAAERLAIKPPSFYADYAVDLVSGVAAKAIDRTRRVVRLADGATLPYAKLALTTGAAPRRLPAAVGGSLPGVHVIRTLADVDALAPACVEGARVTVVGGGYIGLETAAALAGRGLRVTVLEAATRILNRVAPPETARFFRDLHARHGVTIRENAMLAALEGDERMTRAMLSDGRGIDSDLVVVGVGVTPNTALAGAAGLAIENGVAVDAAGATSDPLIFAAGDCASFPWRGRRLRLESVQNAIDQARAVARSMLGEPAAYDPVPWFWSDQYDVKLQIAGLGGAQDRVIVRPGERPGAQSVWSFRGRELLAVDAMNDARAYMTGKRWLEQGVSPDPEVIADPAAALRTAA